MELDKKRVLEENDDLLPADPNHWRKVVNDIMGKARKTSRSKAVRKYDYVNALPDYLEERVAKIIPVLYEEEEDSDVPIEEKDIFNMDEEETEDEEMREKKAKKDAAFNESTCSEIERLENEFHHFDLKLPQPVERMESKKKKDENWLSPYICKKRRERVKWGTKIYKMERSMNEKTLDEQAEELMDASAERFCDWLNALGTSNVHNISKEKLKSLFAIEGDKSLFASIMTDPKEVHAIAKAVADKWNLPQMAIELKYENYLKNRLKNVPKKVVRVAFGRTVPMKDLPWLPSKDDKPITTVFPEELLSLEVLFKGIRHLRTTKALVEFLESHPKFDKPRFLVKMGMFTAKARLSVAQDVPLYEKLKLKY